MIKCEDLKYELPLYSDGVLDENQRGRIDAHLEKCPLCRQKMSEYVMIGRSLRQMPTAALTPNLLTSIRSAVAARTSVNSMPRFGQIERRRNWADVWLLPSAVGSFATVVIGISMLWTILNSANSNTLRAAAGEPPSRSSILLAEPDRETVELTPLEYANSRLSISGESPSVNPQGALIALTRSLVRGEMKDDEVVVVADVFGNGLARIAEVVEPSSDRKAVEELRNALQSDPDFAPFVPARYDRRADPVRVVLKIQNVNVDIGPETAGL